MPARFAPHTRGTEGLGLGELEDLRHLYAHNYAGEADNEYFGTAAPRRRHVLARGTVVQLTCGGQFDGRRIQLDLPHLRAYANTVRTVLQRFP